MGWAKEHMPWVLPKGEPEGWGRGTPLSPRATTCFTVTFTEGFRKALAQTMCVMKHMAFWESQFGRAAVDFSAVGGRTELVFLANEISIFLPSGHALQWPNQSESFPLVLL